MDAIQYSWQIGLRIRLPNRSWRCGGILISPSFVLTAAHCLDEKPAEAEAAMPVSLPEIEVFHGDDRYAAGERLALDPAWPVSFHPNWKTTGIAYAWDAALLRLKQPVTGAIMAPVRSVQFATGDAVVSGWGNFDSTNVPSETLRAVQLPVVDNVSCAARLEAVDARGDGSIRFRDFLHGVTLCTVSPTDSACVNDSGGPLVVGTAYRPQTIGIVSWGLSRSCGRPADTGDLIAAYTRVSKLAPWILETTREPATVTAVAPGPTFNVKAGNDR